MRLSPRMAGWGCLSEFSEGRVSRETDGGTTFHGVGLERNESGEGSRVLHGRFRALVKVLDVISNCAGPFSGRECVARFPGSKNCVHTLGRTFEVTLTRRTWTRRHSQLARVHAGGVTSFVPRCCRQRSCTRERLLA